VQNTRWLETRRYWSTLCFSCSIKPVLTANASSIYEGNKANVHANNNCKRFRIEAGKCSVINLQKAGFIK
jgi:hypothetical protein